MEKQILTAREAVSCVKDGDTLLVGGFLMGGCPNGLLEALFAHSDARALTIVSNDTGTEEQAMIRLMRAGRVAAAKASYIGFNVETGRMLMEEPHRVELVPQGTLVERIRAGGAGLGGVLTPVGIGTAVAEGKTVLTLRGKQYLVEEPIRGQVAFVKATRADRFGNLFMRGSTKNFNPVMATAADRVIAEVEDIVDALDPELVTVPGILVDVLVKSHG